MRTQLAEHEDKNFVFQIPNTKIKKKKTVCVISAVVSKNELVKNPHMICRSEITNLQSWWEVTEW
jgi:hypothetical protein